jgi:hypothetical protein
LTSRSQKTKKDISHFCHKKRHAGLETPPIIKTIDRRSAAKTQKTRSCEAQKNLCRQADSNACYPMARTSRPAAPSISPPRGCPLNPLLAGFHLYELDRQLASLRGTRYLRFMDNLLILARTRW